MKDLHALGTHEATPEEALQWAVEKLETHDRLLAVVLGRMSGLAYAVQCLIATHPKIEAMQDLWQQALPDLVDSEMESKIHQSEDFRTAFHSQMAMVQKTIDARLSGNPPDPEMS